ncbi:MerR family transcriptional regulator [Georgenia sp. Marseille-Q6866]
MRIGELSARTGCNPHQLRYYESQGLLSSTRSPNGYREYASGAVEVVREIAESLAIGLSTRDIATINASLAASPQRTDLLAVLEIIQGRLDGVEEQLKLVNRARETLEACAAEIQRRMDAAVTN